LPALVFGLFRPFQLFGLLDKGRGDLCCTAVSIDLWTIDLPRPSNHKILLDAGDCPKGVRHLRQAFFWLRVFSALKQSPRLPQCHASRTRAVMGTQNWAAQKIVFEKV